MALLDYIRPATLNLAIKEIADHHRKELLKSSYPREITAERIYTHVAFDIAVSFGGTITWRYPYSVERSTLKPGKLFTKAVFQTHYKMFNPVNPEKAEPTDTRPRLATQFATDEDKDLVKAKLPNDERRDMLVREAKERI